MSGSRTDLPGVTAHASLVRLRSKVQDFWDRTYRAHARHIQCEPECSSCCEVDLGVFPVEADPLAQALKSLDQTIQARVRARLDEARHCALMVDERCVVYGQRPIICRTQGLALITSDGSRTACLLNFAEPAGIADLPAQYVLDLPRLNAMLAILHRLHLKQTGRPDERVRLADLADACVLP